MRFGENRSRRGRLGSWGGPLVAAALASLVPCAAAAAAGPHPGAREAIVQFSADTRPAERRALVLAAGGRVIRDLPLIHGLGVRLSASGADRLAGAPGVRVVSPNAATRATVGTTGERWGTWNPETLSTAFIHSTRAEKAWTDPNSPATGEGVAVAVIDTGVAGDLPDFRTSDTDATSRVIATAVTNPDATTAADVYGHGTHVAGLIAGNSRARPADDALSSHYIGSAPDARIVAIKASDDHGNSSLIDVIAGVQFAVDHRDEYGIRVINLSMSSTQAQSYRTDPLDAAVEAAWFRGIVVVAAAGNRGTAADAVSYAPANDPYVITVGGVDDHATKDTLDDTLAPWSSRGITQDGVAKPELVAPGAHIVAPLATGSDLPSLCPECVVDGRYFRMSGTSMAAPIVAGIAADVLSVHPEWTPDQVKGALTHYLSDDDRNVRPTADGAFEVAADNAVNASDGELVANQGLTPNDLVDPATGAIDYARASWGQAGWEDAADALRASWGRASWGCVCSGTTGDMLPTRASWGRASWSSFFGDTPEQYGELSGNDTGTTRPDRVAQPATTWVEAPAQPAAVPTARVSSDGATLTGADSAGLGHRRSKAYGKQCRQRSRKRVKGRKGTAFSRCMKARPELATFSGERARRVR